MLILASASPRRHQLLSELGFTFMVQPPHVDESFEPGTPPAQVVQQLARRKAAAFAESELAGNVILAADTVVALEDEILNKPADAAEASAMLQQLSGRTHTVYTGISLRSATQWVTLYDSATVCFKALTEAETCHYVQACNPIDKAGAYGIQEWIGLIGVTSVQGSYYTIMGLPTHLVWQTLNTPDFKTQAGL